MLVIIPTSILPRLFRHDLTTIHEYQIRRIEAATESDRSVEDRIFILAYCQPLGVCYPKIKKEFCLKTKVASAASIVAIVLFFSTATAQERASQSGSRRGVTVPASGAVTGDYFPFGGTVEIA